MDRGSIQGICPVWDTQETSCLLKGFWSQSADFLQGRPRWEWSICLAMSDDIFCKFRTDTGYVCKKCGAGGIYIDAHLVDDAFDHAIQGMLQGRLIHIVLVQAHANG